MHHTIQGSIIAGVVVPSMRDVQNTEYHGLSYAIRNQSR